MRKIPIRQRRTQVRVLLIARHSSTRTHHYHAVVVVGVDRERRHGAAETDLVSWDAGVHQSDISAAHCILSDETRGVPIHWRPICAADSPPNLSTTNTLDDQPHLPIGLHIVDRGVRPLNHQIRVLHHHMLHHHRPLLPSLGSRWAGRRPIW